MRFFAHFGALLVLGAAALIAPSLLLGCSGSGPQMSGFAVGDTRIVKINQVIELRIPVRPDGARTWRVTRYDSRYFSSMGRPRAILRDDGKHELVISARTRNLGTTEVEVTEILTLAERAEREPRVRTFKVQIVE